jgi:hypothetical protein
VELEIRPEPSEAERAAILAVLAAEEGDEPPAILAVLAAEEGDEPPAWTDDEDELI